MEHPRAAGNPGETPGPQGCPQMPSAVPESQDFSAYRAFRAAGTNGGSSETPKPRGCRDPWGPRDTAKFR